jgi:putative hydrolase of the HAD superfamily
VSRWRAVVFDLDDTLFAERDYVLSGFAAVTRWAERRTGEPADAVLEALATMFRRGVRGDTFNRWLAARGLDPALAAEMVEVYRSHRPAIRPFPEVPPLLEALRRSTKLGLVSDGYAAVQRAKFDALGLGGYFDAVVFSDEMGRDCWKPSTRPFERVLGLLGVPAAEAVYVGDNCTKDFLGARRAGLATICCTHAGGDYCGTVPPTPEHAADLALESLADLRRALGVAEQGEEGRYRWRSSRRTNRSACTSPRPTSASWRRSTWRRRSRPTGSRPWGRTWTRSSAYSRCSSARPTRRRSAAGRRRCTWRCSWSASALATTSSSARSPSPPA